MKTTLKLEAAALIATSFALTHVHQTAYADKVNTSELASLKANRTNLQSQLENAKDETQKAQIKSKLDSINSRIGDVDKTEKPATNQPRQISQAPQISQTSQSQVKTITLNTSNMSARDAIVANAKALCGVPYVWGGTNPNTGLDCSGLTSYLYAKLGINIGRTTYNQDATGQHISLSELAPGDLILEYGKGHVAVYIGNGMQIAAPEPGDVVKIQPVPYSYGAMYGLRYL